MILTIHQPEHLPWIGFFDKMRQADLFVLLDTTQFAKDDVQNRNRIKARAGSTWLTVPVFKKGVPDQLIEQVEICNNRDWRRRCWNLLVDSYRDAPYFAEHRPFFQDLYTREWSQLVELNVTIIRYLAEHLGMRIPLVLASELGIYAHGPTRVNLSICRALGADTYLSGVNGRRYLDLEQYAAHNITVIFQEFTHPTYPQLWGEFIPNLSVIDLLFNCGPRCLEILTRAIPPDRDREAPRQPISTGREAEGLLPHSAR